MDQDLEQTRYWRTLRRKITAHFSLGELKVLCHDVMVDYDELAGEEKVEKVSNLIGYLARRGRLADLVVVLKEERPKVDWEENIPAPDKQVQDAEKLFPPAKDDLILREYLERLQKYLPADALEKAREDSRLQKIIATLTNTYLEQLDLWRRTRLVRHLGEHNLQAVVPLASINLIAADLSGVNLQGANLYGAILVKAFLAHANLQEADLTGADLRGALLANSNLQRANLLGANLEYSNFYQANLREVNLSEVRLGPTDFSEADLRDCTFAYSGYATYDHFLQDVKLEGALVNSPPLLSKKIEDELKKGDFETALADAIKLCELDGEEKWYCFLRGVAYKGTNNEDMANRDFQTACCLPENGDIAVYINKIVDIDNTATLNIFDYSLSDRMCDLFKSAFPDKQTIIEKHSSRSVRDED